jgi:hypothetical protein
MVDIMSTYGSTSFTSKCPGAIQWRTLSDGKIEVEGLGVPYADEGGYHGDGAVIRKVWDQYKDFILRASERSGIPARWILALIIIESRGVNHGVNSAGAGGMMGMMLQATGIGLKKVGIDRPATKADVADPEMNILAGAGFMRHQADTFGWELPIIAVSHNAGSPKCSPTTRCKSTIDGAWTFDGTNFPNSMGMVEDCTTFKGTVRGSAYALRAVKVNNSAIQMGIGDGGFWLSQDVMLVGFSVAALAVIASVFSKQTNAAIDFIFGDWLLSTLLLLFPLVRRWDARLRQVSSHRPGVPDERGGDRRLPRLPRLPDGPPRLPRQPRRARRQRSGRGHRPHGPGGRHQLLPPQGRERGVPALQLPPLLHQGQGPSAEAGRRSPFQGGGQAASDPRRGGLTMAKLMPVAPPPTQPERVTMKIGPEQAKALLDKLHPMQRSVTRRAVAEYAETMKAGLWTLSPHGIVIDAEGRLVDGQHRMQAVVKSGVTCEFDVCYLPAGASIRGIDRGRSRTLVNLAEMEGILEKGSGKQLVPAARVLYCLSLDRVDDYDFDSVMAKIMAKSGGDLRHATNMLGRDAKSAFPIAAIAYALPVAPKLIEGIVRRVRDNDGLAKGSGAWHIQRILSDRKAFRAERNANIENALRILRALQAEMTGETLKECLARAKSETDAVPKGLAFFRKAREKAGVSWEVL